jgi:hypothetical protein
LRHLFLGLVKIFTESLKLFPVHFYPSFWERRKIICSEGIFLLDMLYHVVLLLPRFFLSARNPKRNFYSMARLRGEVYSPPAIEDCFPISRNGRT